LAFASAFFIEKRNPERYGRVPELVRFTHAVGIVLIAHDAPPQPTARANSLSFEKTTLKACTAARGCARLFDAGGAGISSFEPRSISSIARP
jgi:hypothetical protein